MLSLPWRRRARTTAPARITAAALIGSAATVAALVATDVIPVPSWALDGIDVASHQHPGNAAIDWTAVKASGQDFAFIKASEGTGYINPYFADDSQKAQQAGVMPGSYHYAKPQLGTGRAEARYYAAALATGSQPSLPPVLDLEETGGLNTTQLQDWVRDFVDEIRKLTGRDPIMYTSPGFWQSYMGNTTEFSELPLWLAYWSSTPPTDLPGGWDYITFWQYSETGTVNGVRGTVDLNKYYGDDAQLQALAQGSPSGTLVGEINNILAPIQGAGEVEAGVANQIEAATGINVPLTTDFLMLLLGVAGGRIGPEVILDQGAAQFEGLANDPEAAAGSLAAAAPEGGNGSVAGAQQVLSAIMAITGALRDLNASGKAVPIDALTALVGNSGEVNVGQLLGILQTFGGTQNWSAKLENGEVPADPNALQQLSEAAGDVNAAPAGTPLPPEAVHSALAGMTQGAAGAPAGDGAAAPAPGAPEAPSADAGFGTPGQ